jgi:hypothetical protein
MASLTAFGHELGLTVGWYHVNCHCKETVSDPLFYEGDVAATAAFGFDAVKLDYCGTEKDLDVWARLIEETGRKIVIEACHWGHTIPNSSWCPFHYWRASGDVHPNWGSVSLNAQTLMLYKGLSRPHCWGHSDMMEVGITPGVETPEQLDPPGGLTFSEARAHFGLWAILSSPLILSHDLTDPVVADWAWPIVANREVIAVDQAWAGHSGEVFRSSADAFVMNLTRPPYFPDNPHPTPPYNLTLPTWQQLFKRVDNHTNATAVFVVNYCDVAVIVGVDFASIPSFAPVLAAGPVAFRVRDLHAHADLGTYAEASLPLPPLLPHDSRFFLITPTPLPLDHAQHQQLSPVLSARQLTPSVVLGD